MSNLPYFLSGLHNSSGTVWEEVVIRAPAPIKTYQRAFSLELKYKYCFMVINVVFAGDGTIYPLFLSLNTLRLVVWLIYIYFQQRFVKEVAIIITNETFHAYLN